jgi:hypothetical protein
MQYKAREGVAHYRCECMIPLFSHSTSTRRVDLTIPCYIYSSSQRLQREYATCSVLTGTTNISLVLNTDRTHHEADTLSSTSSTLPQASIPCITGEAPRPFYSNPSAIDHTTGKPWDSRTIQFQPYYMDMFQEAKRLLKIDSRHLCAAFDWMRAEESGCAVKGCSRDTFAFVAEVTSAVEGNVREMDAVSYIGWSPPRNQSAWAPTETERVVNVLTRHNMISLRHIRPQMIKYIQRITAKQRVILSPLDEFVLDLMFFCHCRYFFAATTSSISRFVGKCRARLDSRHAMTSYLHRKVSKPHSMNTAARTATKKKTNATTKKRGIAPKQVKVKSAV